MISKICSSCGSRNDPSRINCWNCASSLQDSSLSSVSQIPSESTFPPESPNKSVTPSTPAVSIVCPHCNSSFTVHGTGIFYCTYCGKEHHVSSQYPNKKKKGFLQKLWAFYKSLGFLQG